VAHFTLQQFITVRITEKTNNYDESSQQQQPVLSISTDDQRKVQLFRSEESATFCPKLKKLKEDCFKSLFKQLVTLLKPAAYFKFY